MKRTEKYTPSNRSSMNQIGQFADPETASFFAHNKRDSVHEIWLSWSIGSDDGHKIFQRTQFSKSFIGFEILQLDVFQFDRHFQAYFDISLKTWQILRSCQNILFLVDVLPPLCNVIEFVCWNLPKSRHSTSGYFNKFESISYLLSLILT